MNPPAANDCASDPDELQLPLLGLYADMETGRGSVQLPDEFMRCSCAVRLEIISGWQRALARYAQDALLSLHAELAARQPQLSAAEHKAMFLSTCATLGIMVPADWTAGPAKN